MNKARLMLEYEGITAINQTYSLIRRLPILKKKLPSSFHVGITGKKVLVYLGILKRLISTVINSSIVMAILFLPWHFVIEKALKITGVQHNLGFLQSFFVLCILEAPFVNKASVQEMDKTGYFFLKVFRFPEKAYFLNRVFINIVRIAIGLLAPMLVMGFIINEVKLVMIAYVVTLLMRIFAEFFTMMLKSKEDNRHKKKINDWVMIIIMVIISLSAYNPFTFTWSKWMILAIAPFSLIGAIWGIFMIPRIDYVKVAKYVNTGSDLEEHEQLVVEATFGDVKLEDKKLASPEVFLDSKKHGYDYFHEIMFKRTEKKWAKTLRRKFIIILLVGIAILVYGYVYRATITDLDYGLLVSLKVAIIVSYSLSPGDNFTKILFFYMDKDLLSSHYYREPQAILKCLKIRLRKLIAISMPTTMVVLITMLGFFGMFYEKIGIKYFMIIPVVLISNMFFSLCALLIYYLLQPYNVNMEAKSYTASFAKGVIWFVSIVLMQGSFINWTGLMIVCGVMTVTVIVAPYMLKSLAAKRFKLQEE